MLYSMNSGFDVPVTLQSEDTDTGMRIMRSLSWEKYSIALRPELNTKKEECTSMYTLKYFDNKHYYRILLPIWMEYWHCLLLQCTWLSFPSSGLELFAAMKKRYSLRGASWLSSVGRRKMRTVAWMIENIQWWIWANNIRIFNFIRDVASLACLDFNTYVLALFAITPITHNWKRTPHSFLRIISPWLPPWGDFLLHTEVSCCLPAWAGCRGRSPQCWSCWRWWSWCREGAEEKSNLFIGNVPLFIHKSCHILHWSFEAGCSKWPHGYKFLSTDLSWSIYSYNWCFH